MSRVTVKSPIKGVVARVADNVVEGTYVEQGQFIVELQPNAANLVEQKQDQLQDLRAKLATAETKWAFINYATGQPIRVPPEIARSFVVVDR